MPLASGAFEAFQAGRQTVAGSNPIANFISGITEQAKKLMTMRQEQTMKTAGEVQTTRALMPFKVQQAGLEAGAKTQAEMGAFQTGMPPGMSGGVITEGKFGPFTMEFPGKTSQAIALEPGKTAAEYGQVALDVENQARNLTAAWKIYRERAGGAGRKVGLQSIVAKQLGEYTPFKVNPEAVALEGQLTEMATSLARMITGTSRPAVELIQALRGTLPKLNSTDEEFFTQLRNTLHNTSARALARQGQTYTPDARAAVDMLLKEVLSTPPAKGLHQPSPSPATYTDIDEETLSTLAEQGDASAYAEAKRRGYL